MTRTLLLLQKSFRARSAIHVTRLTACCFHSSSGRLQNLSEFRAQLPNGDRNNGPPTTASPWQVSINANTAANTNHQDILEALENFNRSSENQADVPESDPMAIVILATPAFAQWLEDGSGFIQQVLHKLTKNTAWSPKFHREIDVICACVDGLSPKPSRIPYYRGQPPIEGFSFLYGKRELVLPEWKDDEALSPSDSSLQSSITFSKSVSSSSFDITLPLATTLFTNGRHSTLLVSKWWQTSANTFVKTKGPTERKNVTIQISHDGVEKDPESYIPIIALTPARRIVNGLGNIVRRLDFGDDNIGPASQELETAVAAELKGRPREKLDIWAMIIPSQAIAQWEDDYYALATDQTKVLERQRTSGIPDYPYIGHWLAQGAILCRVLSGGGGWGAKQGLLSLDPQTTYDQIDEARFDFSEGSLEEQQASALGTLAREGDFIQFFTAKTKSLPPYKYGPQNEYHKTDISSSTVIGTTPSTRDKLPSSEGREKTGAKEGKSRISIRSGHFGCVSESGIFLRRNDRDLGPWVTKVDLPYSYLFYNYDAYPRTIRLFDPRRRPRFRSN